VALGGSREESKKAPAPVLRESAPRFLRLSWLCGK
jgi:hypothetical protein